jgi:sulfite reductase (NADPH) hemoprotein beta-component
VIVDPYTIEVKVEDGLPVPAAFRERVRALGPTIHEDMGKQTAGGPVIDAIAHAAGAARSAGRARLIRR